MLKSNTSSIKPLSAKNPLDHLRLLWWMLVIPQQLKAYREKYGQNAERSVSKWLASTLTPFQPRNPRSLAICNLKFHRLMIAECGLRIADYEDEAEFRLNSAIRCS